jgi:hypothetical protein
MEKFKPTKKDLDEELALVRKQLTKQSMKRLVYTNAS